MSEFLRVRKLIHILEAAEQIPQIVFRPHRAVALHKFRVVQAADVLLHRVFGQIVHLLPELFPVCLRHGQLLIHHKSADPVLCSCAQHTDLLEVQRKALLAQCRTGEADQCARIHFVGREGEVIAIVRVGNAALQTVGVHSGVKAAHNEIGKRRRGRCALRQAAAQCAKLRQKRCNRLGVAGIFKDPVDLAAGDAFEKMADVELDEPPLSEMGRCVIRQAHTLSVGEGDRTDFQTVQNVLQDPALKRHQIRKRRHDPAGLAQLRVDRPCEVVLCTIIADLHDLLQPAEIALISLRVQKQKHENLHGGDRRQTRRSIGRIQGNIPPRLAALCRSVQHGKVCFIADQTTVLCIFHDAPSKKRE